MHQKILLQLNNSIPKKMKLSNQLLVAITLLFTSTMFAQEAPYFKPGEDPKQSQQEWKLIDNMSDEFDEKK